MFAFVLRRARRGRTRRRRHLLRHLNRLRPSSHQYPRPRCRPKARPRHLLETNQLRARRASPQPPPPRRPGLSGANARWKRRTRGKRRFASAVGAARKSPRHQTMSKPVFWRALGLHLVTTSRPTPSPASQRSLLRRTLRAKIANVRGCSRVRDRHLVTTSKLVLRRAQGRRQIPRMNLRHSRAPLVRRRRVGRRRSRALWSSRWTCRRSPRRPRRHKSHHRRRRRHRRRMMRRPKILVWWTSYRCARRRERRHCSLDVVTRI